MSGLSEIMAEHKARQCDEVESATFGHLAPEDGRIYDGSVVFAYGEHGDIVPVHVRFDELPDSPWFFDGLSQHLFDLCYPKDPAAPPLDHGVYVWRGTYRMTEVPAVYDGPEDDEDRCVVEFARTAHHFTGTTTRIEVPA